VYSQLFETAVKDVISGFQKRKNDVKEDKEATSIRRFISSYLEPCWSLHQVNNRDMQQFPIPLIDLETALRPLAICRVRRPSNFKPMRIRLGFIWNGEE
jgi:hypothetical protein